MRTGGRSPFLWAAILLAAFFSFSSTDAGAGGRNLVRLAEMDSGDNGGAAINLTVQEVTVRPARAFVGDPIEIEVVIDNRQEGSETTWVEIYANGKSVAKQMFRWGTPGAYRTSKVHAKWDTSGMAPGEYRVKAEAFVFEDIDPFDNEFTLKQPVILASPGGEFPGGATAGGSVTEIDPRYK